MTNNPLLNLEQLTVQNAEAASAQLMDNAQSKFGFVPNMYGYMANSSELFQTYCFGYENFRNNSGFTPAEQEVVFLIISVSNNCHYCVAAHSMIADMVSDLPKDCLEPIRTGKPLPDPKLNALAEFTRTMVESRGLPSAQQIKTFLETGFNKQHVLNIILAISTKIISNYVNHLADTPVDQAFANYTVEPLNTK